MNRQSMMVASTGSSALPPKGLVFQLGNGRDTLHTIPIGNDDRIQVGKVVDFDLDVRDGVGGWYHVVFSPHDCDGFLDAAVAEALAGEASQWSSHGGVVTSKLPPTPTVPSSNARFGGREIEKNETKTDCRIV